jgi:MinD superfamily P-loop ATPase
MSATIISFIGAKGGVGATTLCVELAKLMRARTNVTLIDADFSARRSAAILLDANRALDTERSEGHIPASVRTHGITVGELATTYADGFTLSPDDVEVFLQRLESEGTILVDMPSPFSAAVRSFVVRTSRFIIATEPTVLGLAAARSMIAEMESFGIPASRVGVVIISRADRGTTLSYVPPQRALDVKVYGEIPAASDRGYQRAVRSLDSVLATIAPETSLSNLHPSSSGAIRDRRLRPRDEGGYLVALPSVENATLETPFAPSHNGTAKDDGRSRLKAKIHETLAERVDLLDASKAQGDSGKLNELRASIDRITQDVLDEQGFSGSAEDLAQIKQEIMAEALGYGPLEDFMSDPTVTEIMANGPNRIYVERGGIIYPTDKKFADDKQLRLVIERIIAPLGRRVDESSPMVDARLPDGSRVNAIVEPLSIDGPSLTIRRFGTRRVNADDMLKSHTLNQPMLNFLRACIMARLNVVISGGTG